jgi:hypothetical protein
VTALAQLQQQFQHYLLRGEAAALEPQVLGTARVPVATRLAIYGGAYRSRLADALGANYPALATLIGETDFDTLAEAYIGTHDSPYFSIRYYGDDLAQFLATHEDYTSAPVLAELARWEWAMTGVFDAADATALDPQALAQLPPAAWAQARFTWHPSVTRLDLMWNVPQLWQALTDATPRPTLELASEAVPWLLWREELTTYFRSLGRTEAAALDAARSGWPFGELCELLCEEVGAEAAAAQAATLLRGWIGAGLIVSVA